MSVEYQVTLKKEVLCEIAADIGARYWHYMRNQGLNLEDIANPVVQYDREIGAMDDAILGCNTLEELNVFSDRLKELRKVIERLEEECKKKSWLSSLRVSLLKRSKKYIKTSQNASSL